MPPVKFTDTTKSAPDARRAARSDDAFGARSWALIVAGAVLVAMGLIHASPSRGADPASAVKATASATAGVSAPSTQATPASTNAQNGAKASKGTKASNTINVARRTANAAMPVAMIDAMRGTTPLDEESRPPPLGNHENKDVRRNRAFPMQPPTIPHRIDGYQVDRNANKCLTCHSRTRIEESKAIPVPASHYVDRDGHMLGDVSTRRYFCTACHVPQDEVKPLVDNTFQDFDTLRSGSKAGAATSPRK
jgi:cytochrome c-type protein NapB